MLYETQFLKALAVTCLVETPIVFILAKFVFKKKENLRILLVGCITSILTLPYIWFVLRPYLDAHYYIYTVEFLVTIFEAIMISVLLEMKWYKGLIISFIANLASFLVGLLLFY